MTYNYFSYILFVYFLKKGECVFTTQIGKRVTAFALVGLLSVNTYVGFRILNKLNNKDKTVIEFSDESKKVTLPQEDVVEFTGTANRSDDNGIDFNNDGVFKYEDIEHKELCNLYDRLLVSGLDTKDINRELNNILLVKLSGLEPTTEERLVLFNNLNRTVSKEQDVIDVYYPLAKYTHLNNCTEVHSMVDDNLTCNGLKQESSGFKVETFSEYVTRKALESGSLTMVDSIQRILISDYTLNECLIELDAVYTLCSVPTDVSEETWNKLFGKLLTTTGEFENVCYVYYDLALLVHKLTCEYPHYVNEFGVTECKSNMSYLLK